MIQAMKSKHLSKKDFQSHADSFVRISNIEKKKEPCLQDKNLKLWSERVIELSSPKTWSEQWDEAIKRIEEQKVIKDTSLYVNNKANEVSASFRKFSYKRAYKNIKQGFIEELQEILAVVKKSPIVSGSMALGLTTFAILVPTIAYWVIPGLSIGVSSYKIIRGLVKAYKNLRKRKPLHAEYILNQVGQGIAGFSLMGIGSWMGLVTRSFELISLSSHLSSSSKAILVTKNILKCFFPVKQQKKIATHKKVHR